MSKSSTQGFLRQGSILALTSIIVRLIGLIYRIPLANIIGDEGNGIYSAAFEIYSILLIISSYGMPMAVSKMVSGKLVSHRFRDIRNILKCSLIFCACTGGAAALFVFFGSDMLEHVFFSKYRGIAIPLKILAPTIFIVAIMGVLRGFFQGFGTMMPTSVSQIIEQIVNAIVSIFAAYFLIIRHSADIFMPAYGAAGGTLGTCIGAISGLIFLIFIMAVFKIVIDAKVKRDHHSHFMADKEIFRLILWTVIPIVLSQTVYNISGIIDITIFNNVLGSKGLSAKTISTWQGIYSTKYRLLVSVPIAISTAFASSMIPSLVKSFTENDLKTCHDKVDLTVKFNMLVAIPSAFGLAALSYPIIRLLFPASDYVMGGRMLILGSSCVIFYALSTVTSSVLQSIDRMNVPVINALISLGVHIVLVLLLLYLTPLGVYALVIGNVTYPLLVCILNAISVKKYLGLTQEMKKTFLIPVVVSVFMTVICLAVYALFKLLTHTLIIPVLLSVLVSVIVFFAGVLKLKVLDKNELYQLPFGRTIYSKAVRFGLMR
ncbi:MAG: polysaccharide biosynthesis protein [Lachnospiraceae bacterium]|jgi:stage V sporulation protein B|nr:polysaccharide biosynthesis protein [Lachnospiraceae bacterium]MEE3461606.1 polysaccharide biosynthesis protein [Lachnospiraceae bacterium]